MGRLEGSPEEVPLAGGWLSNVVRVGDTVRRLAGAWTPSVHALLRYLESAGYPYSPRVLGIDERGREVLTYIPGEAAYVPWPGAMRADAGLAEFARALALYHQAVAGFVPPSDAVWRTTSRPLRPGEVICHGDFAPWNSIWRDGRLAGIIDWDLAAPGPALHDVAYAAWYAVPLHHEAEINLQGPADLRQRLRLFCAAAGDYSPATLLRALDAVQALERERLDGPGARGVEPWATFVARGERQWLAACRAWLAENRRTLLT